MKKSKKVTLAQKAKKAGIPAQIVYNRMHEGWSEKKALSVPVNKYTKKKPEKVAYTVKDLKEADKKYKKAVSDFESIKPRKVSYKVEPKKEQAVGSRVKHTIPLPVQKFEAPKSKMFIYLAIVLLVALIVVVAR